MLQHIFTNQFHHQSFGDADALLNIKLIVYKSNKIEFLYFLLHIKPIPILLRLYLFINSYLVHFSIIPFSFIKLYILWS